MAHDHDHDHDILVKPFETVNLIYHHYPHHHPTSLFYKFVQKSTVLAEEGFPNITIMKHQMELISKVVKYFGHSCTIIIF